jgi:multidrug efflux system membrane fusion protein
LSRAGTRNDAITASLVKAEQRLLTLGPTDGPLVSVVSGLKDDDRIIVGNLQKIGPGSAIQPLPTDGKPKS